MERKSDTHPIVQGITRHARALHQAFQSFGDSVGGNWNRMQNDVQDGFQRMTMAVVDNIFMRNQGSHDLRAGSVALGSAFASMSSHALGTPNPIFEISYNPEVIKKRLSGIPVYVVVNQKNEFVLVSGENSEESRQLGLFFFDVKDAEDLLETVKKQDPQIGRQARVLQTSMDAVYEVAVTPREHSGTEGVSFRFMPAAEEVDAALGLYHAANIDQSAFEGVPLFQAEGLVVRGDQGNRYTPLFFSKHDLDIALSNAVLSRDTDAQASARAKLERAKAEVEEARMEIEAAASDPKAKRAAEKRRHSASSRVKRYEKELADATAQRKPPRIDVGSLEQVIVEMERDDKNQWGDVIFVRRGYTSDADGNKEE